MKGHNLLLGGTGATDLVFLKHITTLPPTSWPKATAHVCGRSELPSHIQADESISVVEGALDDASALSTAMQGVTTVISFLGAYLSVYHAIFRTTSTPIADCFPAIFDDMRTNNVTRILALNKPSAFPQPSEVLSWKWWFLTTIVAGLHPPQGKAEMQEPRNGLARRLS